MANTCDFPFNEVVLTFPDQRSASAAAAGPLNDLKETFPDTRFRATCDPYDARVGSGGGTLHAIVPEDDDNKSINHQGSILIIHAGGESSRCPTQMVLGKAWSSIPTVKSGKCRLLTPIHIWLDQCTRLFSGIPEGSVVVVASDTLLGLPSEVVVDWSEVKEDSVIGLSVPAPLPIARNHGVYVVHGHGGQENFMLPCQQVLQKPSLETLQSFVGESSTAWIDTGVVIFPPKAASALRNLAYGALSMCTGVGLQKSAPGNLNLTEYSRANAIKVDLYTHILHAFSLARDNESSRRQEYLRLHADVGTSTASAVYDELSSFSLHAWGVSQGSFLHLGTTRELVDFYIQGSGYNKLDQTKAPTSRDLLCRNFGNSLGMTRRLGSLALESTVDSSAVLIRTIVEHCDVKCNTVIEHSNLAHCSVGAGCLISGLTSMECNINIPDGIMIQQTPLQAGSDVIMVVGVDDNIKSDERLYGRDLRDFLEWSGLARGDLWGPDVKKPMLWNAKIHPVLRDGDSYAKLFGWLSSFCSGWPCNKDEVRLLFKENSRLSLSEIRDHADGQAKFDSLQTLRSVVIPSKKKDTVSSIRSILFDREHSPVDLSFATDDYLVANDFGSLELVIDTLEGIVLESWSSSQFDICARVCMVLSYVLSEVSNCPELTASQEAARNETGSNGSRDDLDQFVSLRRQATVGGVDSAALSMLSARYEKFAQACVAQSVCPSLPTLEKSKVSPYDEWVLVTSSARVDLSGGWTDTPPICYEFGSVVAGIAVEVDGRKPLACRARLVPGKEGVLLCTESRNLEDGNLLSCTKTEVLTCDDLKSYNNPLSECALLKCALICLGLSSPEALNGSVGLDLQSLLRDFCGVEEQVRLEVVSSSFLPQGSGLGTSSILAGCVLSAVGSLVGMSFTSEQLMDTVLVLEQYLTTGGGFQDQVNGILGGAKVTTCEPSRGALNLKCETIPLRPAFERALNDRLILVHTGKTRLAKNILQQVLRRWACRSREITETVDALVSTAQKAREVLQEGEDVDALGHCLSAYWQQKKSMAGPDSNAEPAFVGRILSFLESAGTIVGGSLCGAGGGGFLVLVAAAGVDRDAVQNSLRQSDISAEELDCLEWHSCTVSSSGMTVTRRPNSDDFDEGFWKVA